MNDILPFILSGGLSVLITLFETITSKYPNTWIFLLKRSKNIYLYSLIYGIISICFLFVLLWIISIQLIEIKNPLLINPLLQAIIVGISTKAILHINIFSAKLGIQNVPIGFETITLLFEPYFISQIDLDEYNYVREFIDEKARRYSTITEVKNIICKNVPRLTETEWKTFLIDLNDRETVSDAMYLYLRNFGVKNFERIFN